MNGFTADYATTRQQCSNGMNVPYTMFTEKIVNKMSLPKKYKIIDFSWRVDGSTYIVVKHDKMYLQKTFSYDMMKMSASSLARMIKEMIVKYFKKFKT